MDKFSRFRQCFWLILFLLFCLCVALKLNGSSVGMWEQELSGRKASKGLLLFQPQPIRTDEWLVWTPAALSQARHIPPFAVENPNLGPGRAPLLFNLPVAYYTSWFRPQLWGFFILDFERGFSFCWFAKIFAVLLAPAWLLRQLGVRSWTLDLFGGLWIFISLQWWFSSPAMLPEMIATWAICTGCGIRFFQQANRWNLAMAFAAFAYCGVNFVLCCYPPAQIPLVYLMATIVVGCVFERRQGGEFCRTKRGLLLAGLAVLVVLVVLVPCYLDIRPTLELVAQTGYPGSRRSTGGAFSLFQLFSGLASFFETKHSLPAAYTNITLPNRYFPFWPAVTAAILVARFRQRIAISPLFVALIIFIVSLAVYCVFGFPGWLLSATLLNFSSEHSVQLAIALANIVLTCLFLHRYRAAVFTNLGAFAAAAVFSLAIALLFWTASLQKPHFFPDRSQIASSFAASVVLLVLFFWETGRSSLPAAVIALVFFSVGNVNPLMRGLSPLLDSAGFQAVERIHASDSKAKWIAYGNLLLPELVKATGADVINGFRIVPDLDFLHRFDPSRRSNFVYNRYGHLVCRLPEYAGQITFQFAAADYYILYVSPGYSDLRELGCRYVALPDMWPDAELHGFTLLQKIPEERLYIYRRQ